MTDDAELLRRYADEKSEEAFAQLVRRHLSLVYHAALRQCGGDAHRAEDVAQAVFTDLARKAGRLARRPVLAGWLYTSTRYAAAQAVRTEVRRQAREREAHAMNEILAKTEEENTAAAEWERMRPVIDEALHALGERDREAVLLRFFEGRAFAEIGGAMRLPEDAARMRVERALEKLRVALGRRGITSTAAALGGVLANQAAVAAPAGVAASVTGAALAGAAVVGAGESSLLSFFTYMSTTKTIAVVTGIVALLAVGTAVFEANIVRESGTALAAVNRERGELRARLAAMEERTALAVADRAALQAKLDDLRAGATKTVTPDAARSSGRATGPFEYVLDHPESRPAFLQHAALTAKIRFERFFQTARLTGEQQDKFLKLIMDDAEGRLEVFAMRRAAGGLDPNSAMDPAATERMSAVAAQHDTEVGNGVRELLGDEAKPMMRDYMRTLPERNVADQLASQLYYTEAPLTAEQADRLVQILAQNRHHVGPPLTSRSTMGGTVIPREWANISATLVPTVQGLPWMQDSPVTDAAVAGAAIVLTSSQMAALKVLQARQAADLQLVPPGGAKDGKKRR